MATGNKGKNASAGTIKKAETKKENKKTTTMEQIEKLEKALEAQKANEAATIVPEEIKPEDINADIEPVGDETIEPNGETPEPIDFEKQVHDIIDNVEPSAEIKEQIADLENGKEEFNEKLGKEPENAEKLVQEELKRVEAIKKKAEAIKSNIQKETRGARDNDGFTNWWNGTSGLY